MGRLPVALPVGAPSLPPKEACERWGTSEWGDSHCHAHLGPPPAPSPALTW